MSLITHDTAVNVLCFRLQATVGAGLPVIATLRHLIETGDKILRVEGIFSGTLSYIFNSFKPGTTFSSIVAQVRMFTQACIAMAELQCKNSHAVITLSSDTMCKTGVRSLSLNACSLQAKELGYTEPDPRDDLAGMDVARKVTILARYTAQSVCLPQNDAHTEIIQRQAAGWEVAAVPLLILRESDHKHVACRCTGELCFELFCCVPCD